MTTSPNMFDLADMAYPSIQETLKQLGSMEHVTKVMDELAKINSMDKATDVLNNMARAMGGGSDNTKVQDVFYGFNKLPQLPALPHHIENQGLIFFTRPELNLSYDNIAMIRKLSFILNSSEGTPNSYGHAIKSALDPISQRDPNNKVRSKLTDPDNPYLTYFSNLCTSMSQPPDIGIQTFTTPEGMMKEQWLTADGIADHHGYYDITATFAGMQGNPIMLSIYVWLYYIQHLRIGPCVPHPINRAENRMDYFTRIERFTFEPDGRTISNWWHTGAAIPKNLSIGSLLGYNKLENIIETREVSVQFGCVGSIFNDPIQLFEFNMRMMRYNPLLADDKRKSHYVRVHPADYGMTNYYGYPLIDLNTMQFDWWMSPKELEEILKGQRTEGDEGMYKQLTAQRNSIDPRYNPYRT